MSRKPDALNVKEKEYDYVKQLLSDGVKLEKIIERTGRNAETIRNVSYSNDYEDYTKTPKKELRQRGKRNKTSEQVKTKEVCNHEMNNIKTNSSEKENEDLRIRVSFELGETAKKAIDGLLALAGVTL